MAFYLPDIIVESVIREGFRDLQNQPQKLDEIFSTLTLAFASKNYGQAEILRIKEALSKEIPFKSNFPQSAADCPCISLQLSGDEEDTGLDRLEDFDDEVQTEITDPIELAKLVTISGFTPTNYDPISGYVSVADEVDLSGATPNMLFVDVAKNKFKILGAFNNLPGQKHFGIGANLAPNISGPCAVQSSITFTQNTLRGTSSRQRVMLGVHTQERLFTSYLYTALKYVLNSRKLDLITRGFKEPVLSGADFVRDGAFTEPVFSRGLTISGFVQDEWVSEAVQPIEFIDLEVKVQRATASNEALDLEDQTVQVDDSDFQEF